MSARPRILAADDDRITRRLLAVNLERWGYEVVMAADGLEAWEILQSDGSPEIVVLDWVMPGMDGIEVCRALRKSGEKPRHYVLLLAAQKQRSDVIAAFEAGADDYISKPINLRDLEERLLTARRNLETRQRFGVVETRAGEIFEPSADVTRVEPESPTQATLAGKVVGGKYKVIRPIASGGMGTVWEGSHLTLGTRVAIKFIRPEYTKDNDSMARFETEARVMARLNSRHAVHVYDYGVTPGGLPYLVMEYLEGRSLTDVIERDGPLQFGAVASVIAQAAHALEKAHKLGIIHRDVKPDNIMLIPDDEVEEPEESTGAGAYHVKLVDFGVAKVLLENNLPIESDGTPMPLRRPTARGVLLGTPAFMSPEQLLASGVADKHADLWGLAVCAFVSMTGKLPFNATSLGDLVKQVCLNPPPVPSQLKSDIPMGFDAWFARACASSVPDRFQSGYEFSRELLLACGVARQAAFPTYPTPLPGYPGDVLTPATGVPAMPGSWGTGTPAPIPNSDRTGPRAAFSPTAPRAASSTSPSLVSIHPADLHSTVGHDRVRSSGHAPASPARTTGSDLEPDRTRRSAPLRSTELEASQSLRVGPLEATGPAPFAQHRAPAVRISIKNIAVAVMLVLMLCGAAFALGASYNS